MGPSGTCTTALPTWPHGERNNIYGNGTGGDGSELSLYAAACHALPVDWKNNYWGPAILDAPQKPIGEAWPDQPCSRAIVSAYQPGGWLAHASPSAWTTGPRPGPIKTGRSSQSVYPSGDPDCPTIYYTPTWNAFDIGPGDFQPSYMPHHTPSPTTVDLLGDASPGVDGGLEATPNLVKCNCGDPVDCATGNFYEPVTDLVVPGLNGGLSFDRTYNSLSAAGATASGPLGYGWSMRFADSLAIDPYSGNAIVTGAAGNTMRFYTNPDGSYWAPAWVQATLGKNGDGSYTYALPSGRSEHFDGTGRLQWEQDANGNRTTLTYTSGQLTSVTDPSGRSLAFAYNADGRISQITDPAGRAVQYVYSSAGDLTSVTDVAGHTTTYSYDGAHRLTKAVDPRGGTVTNTYDSAGRVTSQTTPDGGATSFSYSAGRTTVTDPSGVVTDELFENGLPVSITRGYGSATPSTTGISYDGALNPATITDANGHAWSYGYDSAGNLTSITDPLGHTTSSTYDADRNVTSVTTPAGHRTTIDYDVNDNPTAITQRLSETGQTATTSMAYFANGLLKTVKGRDRPEPPRARRTTVDVPSPGGH